MKVNKPELPAEEVSSYMMYDVQKKTTTNIAPFLGFSGQLLYSHKNRTDKTLPLLWLTTDFDVVLIY